jgi:hypothetical protein
MKDNLNRSQWDNSEPTDVDRWLEIYAQDDNLFWATDTGHLMNVIDELIYRLETQKPKTIREIITYLKTTPAVTLSGQGGAYELLEAYAQKLEEEND